MRLLLAILSLGLVGCATTQPRVGSWACVKVEKQWHVENGALIRKNTCLLYHDNYVPAVHGEWRN